MGQLNNQYVSSSFQGLLKMTDSTNGLTNTLQTVQTGDGDNSPLQMSLTEVNISGSLFVNGVPIYGSSSGTSGSSGSSGTAGSSGSSGTSGSSGSGFTYNGIWSNSTNYKVNDVVLYNGQTYVALSDNTNKQPSVWPAIWQVFSAAGSSGTSGTSGSNGSSGSSGTSGSNGSSGTSGINGSSGTSGNNGSSGSSGSSGTNGSSGTSGASPFALTGSFYATTNNLQVTGSLYVSSSVQKDVVIDGQLWVSSSNLNASGSLTQPQIWVAGGVPGTVGGSRSGSVELTPGFIQLRRGQRNATIQPGNISVGGDLSSINVSSLTSSVITITSPTSTSLLLGSFDNNLTYDVELNALVNSSGVFLQDYDPTNDYNTFFHINPNISGSNPAPQFDRGLGITGSLNVSGSIDTSLIQSLTNISVWGEGGYVSITGSLYVDGTDTQINQPSLNGNYVGNDVKVITYNGSKFTVNTNDQGSVDISSPDVNITGSLKQSGTFYADQIDVSTGNIVEGTGSYVATFNNNGILEYDTYANIAGALSPYINSNRDGLITTGSLGVRQEITGSLFLLNLDNNTFRNIMPLTNYNTGSSNELYITYDEANTDPNGDWYNVVSGEPVIGAGLTGSVITSDANYLDNGFLVPIDQTPVYGELYTVTVPYNAPLISSSSIQLVSTSGTDATLSVNHHFNGQNADGIATFGYGGFNYEYKKVDGTEDWSYTLGQYGVQLFDNVSGSQFIITNQGGGPFFPVGNGDKNMFIGLDNNFNYLPYWSGQGPENYTDGTQTFYTPLVVSGSLNVLGSITGSIDKTGLITTGSATTSSQTVLGGFNFDTTYTTSSLEQSYGGGSNIIYLNYDDIFCGYGNCNTMNYWLEQGDYSSMPGVTISGTGVSNATVISGTFGDTYYELTLSSGTVTNGATYTFTGPYRQTIGIIGSLSATERITVESGGNSVGIDKNGVTANNPTFSAAINAGIIQLRPQSNNDIFQFAVSSSAMYNGGGQWSGPQIAGYKDGIGDVSLIGFQTDSSWTDGTVTVLRPLVVSGDTKISGSIQSTAGFGQVELLTNQTIGANSDTVITFNNNEFDPSGWYNSEYFYYQPTKPGTYQISYSVNFQPATAGSGQINVQIRKTNGDGESQLAINQQELNLLSNTCLTGTVFAQLDGNVDKIDLTAYSSAGQVISGDNGTYLNIKLL